MLKEVTPSEGWIITEKATLIKLEALDKIRQKTALFAVHQEKIKDLHQIYIYIYIYTDLLSLTDKPLY